jgi:hypothetical protein
LRQSFTILASLLLQSSNAITNENIMDMPKINITDFEQNTIPAKVDNYNYQDKRTYEQRYWINDKYFSIDTKAPIFLYICGEYTCSIREDRLYPFMVGASMNGLLLALEHRFYGES